jgi:hypothetical protein
VNKGASVDAFIKKQLDEAEQDLVAFALQPILKALKEQPDGVSPKYFKKEEYKGIDMSVPEAVGKAMQGSHAVLYDMKEGRYKLISHAHKVALRTYDPIIHGKATKEAEEKAALAMKEAVEKATKEAEEKASKEKIVYGAVGVAIFGVVLYSVRSQ